MSTQSRMLRWLGVCLSLFLVITSAHRLWAQETAEIVEEQISAEADGLAPTLSDFTYHLFFPVIQGEAVTSTDDSNDDSNRVVAAFDKKWSIDACLNVGATEYGLWDDMPSVAREAGLFWFVTNSIANEECEYSALTNFNLSTTSYPRLKVMVAVNDGAVFKVNAFGAFDGVCNVPIPGGSITTSSTDADNSFHLYEVALPSGWTVCKVQIALTDAPDTLASGRASALIDYIEIWNNVTGNVGWRESFYTGT